MLPYTNRARGVDTKNNLELARSCTYDLQSVVVHVGNLETGEQALHSPFQFFLRNTGEEVANKKFENRSLCILLSSRKPVVQVQ